MVCKSGLNGLKEESSSWTFTEYSATVRSLSAVGVTYREENLNAVATAYIGGKGKTEGISGTNVENQTPDRQLEYCLQDAQLCMKLVQKNDYEFNNERDGNILCLESNLTRKKKTKNLSLKLSIHYSTDVTT
jgi:hypothetical protein